MNETFNPPPTTTEPATDAILLMLLLFAIWIIGMVCGIAMCRGNTIARRVELRALQYFLSNPPKEDGNNPIIESIAKRQIRRLENRLNIDNDE